MKFWLAFVKSEAFNDIPKITDQNILLHCEFEAVEEKVKFKHTRRLSMIFPQSTLILVKDLAEACLTCTEYYTLQRRTTKINKTLI